MPQVPPAKPATRRFAETVPDFVLSMLFALQTVLYAGKPADTGALVLLAAGTAAAAAFRVREKRLLGVVMILSGILTGIAAGTGIGIDAGSIPEASGVYVETERTITGFPEVGLTDEGTLTYTARAGRLRIVSPHAALLYPTERTILRGRLYSYTLGGRTGGTLYLNEYQGSGTNPLSSAGIALPAENLSAVEVVSAGFTPLRALGRLRLKLTEKFLAVPDTGLRGLYVAFALGNRNLLDYRTRQSFQMAGLAHLLALSGMHVALISAAIALLLKLWFPERFAFGIAAAVIVLYTAVAGFQPSLVRASAMFLIYDLLKASGRNPDFLEILLVTWAGTILLYPPVVDHAGFWLSYAATGGVVVFTAPVMRILRLDGKPGAVLAGTLAANIAVLPLSFYFFRSVNLLFPLSNLAAILVFAPLSLAIFARIVLTALGLTAPAGLLDGAAGFLWKMTTQTAQVFSLPRWPYVRLEHFDKFHLAAVYAVLAALVLIVPKIAGRKRLEWSRAVLAKAATGQTLTKQRISDE